MNTLKAIQNTSPPTNQHPPLQQRRIIPTRKKNSTLCFGSSSNGSDSDPSSSSSDEGDKRKQELLARIAMLQTQKVRLTNFLDERSQYLTQFAEDANTEFDQIGENALKELDEASSRIMENLDNKMQAFEETAELNRQEIEKNEKVLEDFEDQIQKERNEGMFFKNLGEKKKMPPKQEVKARLEAKLEAQRLKELTKEKAGSKTRRNIYLVLMALLGVTIANAVVSSPEVEWRKVVALGLILMALLAQFIYELRLSSETGRQGPSITMIPISSLNQFKQSMLGAGPTQRRRPDDLVSPGQKADRETNRMMRFFYSSESESPGRVVRATQFCPSESDCQNANRGS